MLKTVVAILLVVLTGCVSTPSKGLEKEPVLLGPMPIFEASPAFNKLVKTAPGSQEYEKARIDYLFERLSKSRYNFIRNDSTYSSARAVMHIKWKYLRYHNEAKTAEDFIENCATGSRVSGRPYLIKAGPSESYRIADIFSNELKVLD